MLKYLLKPTNLGVGSSNLPERAISSQYIQIVSRLVVTVCCSADELSFDTDLTQ